MFLFLITNLFIILYLVRPFELIVALQGKPLIFITLIVSLFLFTWHIVSGKVKIMHNGTDLMVVGILVGIVLSHLRHGWLGGVLEYSQIFLPVLVGYFLVTHTIDSHKKLNFFYNIIICCAIFFAIEGYQEFYHGVSYFGIKPLTTHGDIRIIWVGILSDPNDLGMVFVFAISIVLHRMVEKKYIINICILLLLLVGIFFTKSRGSMLALLVAIIVYFVMRTKSFKGIVISGVLISLLLAFGPSRMVQISSGESSAYGRIDSWYAGLMMFRSFPFFGVGMGSYTDYHHLTAHNSYILAFAELGFFGAFFFHGLFYFPLRISYFLFRKKESFDLLTNEQYKDYCCVSSILAGQMASIFFLSRTYMLLPYLAVSCYMSIDRIHKISTNIHNRERNLESVTMWSHMRNIAIVTVGSLMISFSLMKLTI